MQLYGYAEYFANRNSIFDTCPSGLRAVGMQVRYSNGGYAVENVYPKAAIEACIVQNRNRNRKMQLLKTCALVKTSYF